MRIIVLGAGHVGQAIVEALHEEHQLTVIDIDHERLAILSDRYDVRIVEGNGASKRVMRDAGAEEADLLIACSSREDANLVCAVVVKKMSRGATTIVRTSSIEYLEAWRERELDVDFMVSSELETANAISAQIGLPAARQTDLFAGGQVQIVEFDVPQYAEDGDVIGRPLRAARLPRDSKVVSIIRDGRMILPRDAEEIRRGDRIIVIGSPTSARKWSRMIGRGAQAVDDVVVFGAGRMGATIARVLLTRGMRLRVVDAQRERAKQVAEALPDARVFHASAFDPDFLRRERIGAGTAAVFCMDDDARNVYGAVLAKVNGLDLAMSVVYDPSAVAVYERAGVDVAINPREVTAEEVVRFAHDPRIRQIAMLEHDRFEVLDITLRPESELANRRFKDLPMTEPVIGALIRGGTAIFPHGDEVLLPGDRVIIFVEARHASNVEQVL